MVLVLVVVVAVVVLVVVVVVIVVVTVVCILYSLVVYISSSPCSSTDGRNTRKKNRRTCHLSGKYIIADPEVGFSKVRASIKLLPLEFLLFLQMTRLGFLIITLFSHQSGAVIIPYARIIPGIHSCFFQAFYIIIIIIIIIFIIFALR